MVLAFLLACGPTRKIGQIRQQELAATLALSRNEIEEERKVIAVARRDTLTVQDEGGNTVLIMKAVKDQASGEMVATDVLDAAVITARFRNVAERNGRIDLRFEIIVPALMQDTRWQLRFYPDMFILEDSLRLEPVLITGREYRQQQLRGYQQYEKFLRSIITDSTRFLDYRNLDIFIRRNIPELFALKADSSFVSDEVFHSLYGVTEQAAIAHYTNQFGKSLNERRKSRQDAMYTRYVKVPIVTEGIRRHPAGYRPAERQRGLRVPLYAADCHAAQTAESGRGAVGGYFRERPPALHHGPFPAAHLLHQFPLLVH